MFKIKNLEIHGKVILAPMAGVTNKIYRQLCTKFGAALVYTEMISNVGLKYNSKKTLEYADIEKNEMISLQIFGGNINDYVEAAKYFEKHSNAKIIDINMGCPVKKVAIKSKAGSSLLKTPQKIKDIIEAIVKNISIPLTIKIRIGWNNNNLNHVEIAKIAEKAGASAITVHGRTREQMYKGNVNLQSIKEVKDSVSIPVIGNGDIRTPDDAKKMLDYTNVDAIMIGREARRNPWIFSQVNDYLKTQTYKKLPELSEVIIELKKYYEKYEEYKGPKLAILHIKNISIHWLMRFKYAMNAKSKIVSAKTKDEFWILLDNFENLYYKNLLKSKK